MPIKHEKGRGSDELRADSETSKMVLYEFLTQTFVSILPACEYYLYEAAREDINDHETTEEKQLDLGRCPFPL